MLNFHFADGAWAIAPLGWIRLMLMSPDTLRPACTEAPRHSRYTACRPTAAYYSGRWSGEPVAPGLMLPSG